MNSYDNDADMVVVDGIQLRQVFENIIENALDAMPHGGTLMISTAVVPSIPSKEGIRSLPVMQQRSASKTAAAGLPKKIWNGYSSLFSPRRPKEPDLGLLVRKVTDMHHGEVEALSDLEQGSEFVIRLPHEQGESLSVSSRENASVHSQQESEETRGREKKDPACR